MPQPQIIDESQIELLAPETDNKPRLAKQAIFATLGALALLLPLFPWWSSTGIYGTLLIIAALLITPGLALDGLLFGGMQRISGSMAGITLTTGAAWYAGISALLFSFGVHLDVKLLSIITSATSIFAVILMVITGKAITRIRFNNKDSRPVLMLLVSVIGVIGIAAGSLTVALNNTILQPQGKLNEMYMTNADYNLGNRFVADENLNLIKVYAKSSQYSGFNFVVTFTQESEDLTSPVLKDSNKASSAQTTTVATSSPTPTSTLAQTSIFTSTISTYTSVSNKGGEVSLPVPSFEGCGYIKISNGSLTIDNIPAKAHANTVCHTNASIDIWKKLGIDLSGAPTNSLKDLLKWLSQQSQNGKLDKLPQGYRDCISNPDQSKIAACIDSVK
jgi:hypothetical protein